MPLPYVAVLLQSVTKCLAWDLINICKTWSNAINICKTWSSAKLWSETSISDQITATVFAKQIRHEWRRSLWRCNNSSSKKIRNIFDLWPSAIPLHLNYEYNISCITYWFVTNCNSVAFRLWTYQLHFWLVWLSVCCNVWNFVMCVACTFIRMCYCPLLLLLGLLLLF